MSKPPLSENNETGNSTEDSPLIHRDNNSRENLIFPRRESELSRVIPVGPYAEFSRFEGSQPGSVISFSDSGYGTPSGSRMQSVRFGKKKKKRKKSRRKNKEDEPNNNNSIRLSSRSFGRTLSNLSYIITNNETDEGSLSDSVNGPSTNRGSQIVPFFMGSSGRKNRWENVWMKRMLYITLVFVILTIIFRNKPGDDKFEIEFFDKGNATRYSENKTTDAFIIENVRQSCTEFFEPDDIMSLKNTSTVENKQNGVVAADDGRCSDIGLSILKDLGGNAVDAAIAVALCLGVINPASSGIGGGGFILIHSSKKIEDDSFFNINDNSKKNEKVTEVIDCREVAPAAASVNMYEKVDPIQSQKGGLSIAVPGELRGLELAHSRHGSLPWKDLVEPSIELAKNGFHVSKHLANDISSQRRFIMEFDGLKQMLTKTDANGKAVLLEEGDVLKRPNLARTLKQIAEQGSDAIYNGPVAIRLSKEIQNAGGIITEKDFNDYQPIIRKPLIAKDIYGFTVVGVPPPSSGGASIIGLARMIAGFKDPFSTFADTLSKHRYIEACKHIFAIRMSLSDPAFYVNVTKAAVNDLTKSNYLNELRESEISDYGVQPLTHYGGPKWSQLKKGDGNATMKDMHEGDRKRRRLSSTDIDKTNRNLLLFNYLEDHGTSHFSIIDKDRNAVSMTTTVNTLFGSAVVSPSTGILFNDQMDDFGTPGRPNFYGLQPSKSNFIVPGKRPLSSMSPTLIFRRSKKSDQLGDLMMVLGASGGPKIITAVFQVFFNYAVLGMPLFESISHPRFHNQLLYHNQDVTVYDQSRSVIGKVPINVSARSKEALIRRGQNLLPVDYLGTTQAAVVDLETKRLAASSDIRKGGKPAGY